MLKIISPLEYLEDLKKREKKIKFHSSDSVTLQENCITWRSNKVISVKSSHVVALLLKLFQDLGLVTDMS